MAQFYVYSANAVSEELLCSKTKLAKIPVYLVIFDLSNSNRVIAGTEFGILLQIILLYLLPVVNRYRKWISNVQFMT